MNFFYSLLLPALFQSVLVCAQQPEIPVVGKAVYFDVSPPLRNRLKMPSMKVDQSWKEGVVPNSFNRQPPDEYQGTGTCNTVIQLKNGGVYPDTLLRNFAGLGNLNNVVPPDTYGEAGPAHYFQLVNDSWAIYNKTGVKLAGPYNTSSIWEGLPNNSNSGDGIVLYDEEADRWMISQLSLPFFPQGPFYQMVAVSQTPDPTGSWYRWEFAFGDLPDYPKFGVWPDGYYMSCILLKSQTLQWSGVAGIVFDRNAMIAGDPAPATIQISLTASDSPRSFLPADCDGPFPSLGTPNYFGNTTPGFFVIREFHTNWANPLASTFGNVLKLPIGAYFSTSGGIPQKGTDKLLTPIDDRLMYRLQYRNFGDHQAMVVNHTVGVGSHAGIRWYELRKTNGNWFVHQQSTYSPDTLNRWMGSLAMDPAGNMALGYSVSGTLMFPSIRFTGRMSHDPLGQMTIHETTIMDGTGSQTGIWNDMSRWGDYSSMAVDPTAPSTFWYTQEYYSNTSFNQWKTRIASFSFANILDIQVTALPSVVCEGGSAQLDAAVSGGTGVETYHWTSLPAGFTSDQKNPVVSPPFPMTYILQVTSGSQVKTDSIAIMVIPAPTAFAGHDTVICRYVAELPLTGTVSNCGRGQWFSSGDGFFTDPDALNTLYRLGVNDKISEDLVLKLVAYPAVPCYPVSSSRTITIDACAGLNALSNNTFKVKLFPNPAHDKLTFILENSGEQRITVLLTNPLGETLYSKTVDLTGAAFTWQVDISQFPKGILFLKVQSKTGIIVKPFVVL